MLFLLESDMLLVGSTALCAQSLHKLFHLCWTEVQTWSPQGVHSTTVRPVRFMITVVFSYDSFWSNELMLQSPNAGLCSVPCCSWSSERSAFSLLLVLAVAFSSFLSFILLLSVVLNWLWTLCLNEMFLMPIWDIWCLLSLLILELWKGVIPTEMRCLNYLLSNCSEFYFTFQFIIRQFQIGINILTFSKSHWETVKARTGGNTSVVQSLRLSCSIDNALCVWKIRKQAL